jgi:amino acid transporter
VSNSISAQVEVSSEPVKTENYGLYSGVLGPFEILAQSVSAMAPSTSPSLTIPLVFAISGNATWLVYILAMSATLLIGFCVSRFARLSASPGSLYSFTAETLPPVFGAAAGWGLLLAYLATGCSVAGGALYYSTLLCQQFLHWTPLGGATLFIVCLAAGFVAWRDVKLSADLMLWIEISSVSLICVVLAVLLFRNGIHLDMDQFHLHGVTFSNLGPALVLSMFSFVGFESATTLGAEARNPLRNIPRAVIQCAILAGIFFVLCSYSEVLGFRGEAGQLSETTSPLHTLAAKAGVAPFGTGIDFGALISMIACILACVTAASRVLMRMSAELLVPAFLGKTSRRHGTPIAAVVFCTFTIFLTAAILSASGVSGSAVYDLLGSLAVFGFLTAYALVASALPFACRTRRERSSGLAVASVAAVLVVILIALFDLRSATDASHARLPYIYLIYLSSGLAWYAMNRKRIAQARRAT